MDVFVTRAAIVNGYVVDGKSQEQDSRRFLGEKNIADV
jgi:hypothetical protein